MATRVGLFEAKTQLSKLVDRVEAGEEIAVTRHGKPVAKLSKVTDELNRQERAHKLIERMKALKKKYPVSATQEEVGEWIVRAAVSNKLW